MSKMSLLCLLLTFFKKKYSKWIYFGNTRMWIDQIGSNKPVLPRKKNWHHAGKRKVFLNPWTRTACRSQFNKIKKNWSLRSSGFSRQDEHSTISIESWLESQVHAGKILVQDYTISISVLGPGAGLGDLYHGPQRISWMV